MSLARIALRIAAVEAIKGRTLVGQNVLDSPNGAIDIAADGTMRTDEDRPFVSVYTDAGVVEGMPGRSLLENGSCVLIFEAGISAAMTELDADTGATKVVGIGVPASDEAFEFYLDVVQRQVMDALTDPDNEWAEIYRGLHYRVTKIEVGGRRNTDDGQRLAGHQTKITLDLIDDPMLGKPIDVKSPFAVFLDRLETSADPNNQAHATIMRGLVGGDEPDWKMLQRRNGMTRSELKALGRGPIIQDDPQSTPPFEAGMVEVEGLAQRNSSDVR